MSIQNVQQPYTPFNPLLDTSSATQGQAGASPSIAATSASGPALTAAQQAALVAREGGSLPAQSTVATQGGQPDLPNVQGASRTAANTDAAAGSAIAWLQLKPFHLAASLSELADTLRDNAVSQGQIRNAASQNEYTAMNASAAQQVAEVQGERKSAIIQFAGAAVGAAASFSTASLGAAATLGDAGKGVGKVISPAVGAGLTAGGNALGTLVNQSFTLGDKFAGGQHDADEAKMAKAMQDVLVAVYKSRDEDFSSATQNAHQALQNVLVDLRKEINTNNNESARNIIQSV